MRRNSSLANGKGLGPSKRSSQHLALAPRIFTCAHGACLLGLLAILCLLWRSTGRGRDQAQSAGEGSFLLGAATVSGGESRSLHDSGGRAMFAGQATLHSLSDTETGVERARAAVSEAAAAPAEQQSLGFYWGLKGDAATGVLSTHLAPGVSLEHLQKVAGESAKQNMQGKLTSGFYFAHDIPEGLKAGTDGGVDSHHRHRKELRGHSPPHPLGYYFQEEAHKGGLTRGSEGQVVEAAGPDDKPLKYYFTQDIPDDAKAKLAFKGMMKARMAQEAATIGGEAQQALIDSAHNTPPRQLGVH